MFPRDIFEYIMSFTILLETDTLVIQTNDKRRELYVRVQRHPRGYNTDTVRRNKYHGPPPQTVQQKCLRMMAQTCRTNKKRIYVFRAKIADEWAKQIAQSHWSHYGFGRTWLDIEKEHTKRQSKHQKSLAKKL